MLEIQPTIRIIAKNALFHPWITKNVLDPIHLKLYQKFFKDEILNKFKELVYCSFLFNYFVKKKISNFIFYS